MVRDGAVVTETVACLQWEQRRAEVVGSSSSAEAVGDCASAVLVAWVLVLENSMRSHGRFPISGRALTATGFPGPSRVGQRGAGLLDSYLERSRMLAL